MEKREPSLVPEWLRNSGHGSGVGSSNQLLSSSSRKDSSSLSHSNKNRNFRSRSDVDLVRSSFPDRSFSTNTSRGSSNGSTKGAYSSFNVNRSNRDKDRSREKERLSYMDPWDHDTPNSYGTIFSGRDQEQLRRSHSMITRKQGNHLAQGYTMGLANGGSVNVYNGEGRLPGTSPAKMSRRTGFDKDFPLLRAEDRNGGPDVVRISSPVQRFSVSNPALTIGEGWTSALAEVPVIEKSGAGSHAKVGSSATLTLPTCRNMAKALVQPPSRTGTPPQGSVNTQRLEDRAIKQSRQLIPVVPSAPKGSVLNSSDKSKTKPVVRSGETGLASSRNGQQHSSVLLSNLQSNHGSQIKPDSNKKLVILKLARENGIVAAVKESGSPSQLAIASSTELTTSVRNTNGPRMLNRATVNMVAGKTAEKKLYSQSRNAFYSALKQKTSKTSSCIFPTVEEKENNSKELVAVSDPSSAQHAAERDDDIMERVEKVSVVVGRNNNRFESADRPDEKEAEFLKSLGWDENISDEDEALTEEEIKAFIEQCKKFKPSLVQKLPIIQEATKGVAPNS